MIKEDVRDISQVHEIAQMEVFAKLIEKQATQSFVYSQLAKKVRVTDKTIRNWLEILKSLYYCFTLQPWNTNIARSLIKNPKVYLWDWSRIKDHGAKIENFVASHLLKAVDYWNDTGHGNFGLYYLADLEKREVDFLITKENKPWILLEVKASYKSSLNKNLVYFAKKLCPQYTFQLAFDLEYQNMDYKKIFSPKIISMQSFLSMLV